MNAHIQHICTNSDVWLQLQINKCCHSGLERSINVTGYHVLDSFLAGVHIVVIAVWSTHQSTSECVEIWLCRAVCVPVTYCWGIRA
jgi:hypothetical protein